MKRRLLFKLNYATAAIICLMFVGLISGCAPKQIAQITSSPSGASVYVNGNFSGKTPLYDTVLFKGTNHFDVRVSNSGFVDTTFGINYIVNVDQNTTRRNYHIDLKRKDVVEISLISFEPTETSSGIKISKVEKRSIAYLETIERSPSVKSVQRVTENLDEYMQIGAPIISPIANEMIYYIYTQDDKGNSYSNIWKQTIGSGGKTRITYGSKNDFSPAYSPDGEYIYFSSNRISNNPVLWKIKSSGGGGITKITGTQSEDYDPCVSASGDILAYTSNPPNASESQIWTINVDGSLPTQLREGQSPKISPDDQKILYVKKDRENFVTRGNSKFYPKQIWTLNIDGISPTQLTQNNTFNSEQPRWSPDGKWIVYTSDEGKDLSGNNNNDIWIMHADGSMRTQLTTNGSWDDMPIWSNDGQWIYFRSNRGGNWNIWRFQPVLD